MILVSIVCDACGKVGIRMRPYWKARKGEAAHKERAKLIKKGWSCRAGGYDYCPKHKKRKK